MKWRYRKQEFPPSWYDYPKIISIILSTRKITPEAAEEFLYAHKKNFYDPFKLKSITRIVERLAEALENREKILIHGDYDVDGISGAALLFRAMDRLGFYVDHYIPHRASEGYGVSQKAIEKAAKEGFKVILTVDTGISAFGPAYSAKFKGLDLIITDHHEPKRANINSPKVIKKSLQKNFVKFEEDYKTSKYILPEAYAILNPKLEAYPDPNLAGVGVAFKLLEALYTYFDADSEELYEDLDLVALGTVGDMVPLVKENRIFVKKGLEVLTNSNKAGINALKFVAGISDGEINPFHISFILAPRINAAGRISHANESFELLITEDEEKAFALAENLQRLNNKRREEERAIFEEAMEQALKLDLKENYVLVLSSERWNYGVIGIAASKLVEEFRRPVILITFEQDIGRGSCRSIEEFDMHDTLTRFSEYLESFGGHKLACGLKIRKENLEKFKEELNLYASELLSGLDLEPALEIDGDVQLSDLKEDFIEYYRLLSPFGVGNPEPVFSLKGVAVDRSSIKVHRERHVSFWINEQEIKLRAIYFDGQEKLKVLSESEKIDLAFSINLRDNETPDFELKILDLKPSSNN
uniref:Single-stranded-DNA-specific exonuclease RecJ n=1 Tax=candidate division WOR-3 bacterium TaxID=2052148 RepID=A0A7V3ZWA7_UNCW3